jgi:hypothetical protein
MHFFSKDMNKSIMTTRPAMGSALGTVQNMCTIRRKCSPTTAHITGICIHGREGKSKAEAKINRILEARQVATMTAHEKTQRGKLYHFVWVKSEVHIRVFEKVLLEMSNTRLIRRTRVQDSFEYA